MWSTLLRLHVDMFGRLLPRAVFVAEADYCDFYTFISLCCICRAMGSPMRGPCSASALYIQHQQRCCKYTEHT